MAGPQPGRVLIAGGGIGGLTLALMLHARGIAAQVFEAVPEVRPLGVGINLLLLGAVAMLVGYLTPPRQAVVGQYHDFTVLDRWAVNFNYHLVSCMFLLKI